MKPANDNWPTSIRFGVEPRLVPTAKAARRLHLTRGEFKQKLNALLTAGFPRPCPITGHFDLKAIDTWLDRRAGLQTDTTVAGKDAAQLVSDRLAALG